jgi:hypothetical protein
MRTRYRRRTTTTRRLCRLHRTIRWKMRRPLKTKTATMTTSLSRWQVRSDAVHEGWRGRTSRNILLCYNFRIITLIMTRSLPKCSSYKSFIKSTDLKFDNVCRRKYKHLEYQINTTGFIMMYIFVWYTFDIVDIHIFSINLIKVDDI